MTELVQFTEKPSLPEDWVYDDSVKRAQNLVYKAATMTTEMLLVLWVAHEVLSERRPGKIDVTNVTSNTWESYCDDIGISKMTAWRWFKNAGLIDAHVSHNSGENEWYTPTVYTEVARAVMGSINLDPASSEKANTLVEAETFYTIDDDGLDKKWHGNVWMNPPYSKELIPLFIKKVVNEYLYGEVAQACVIVNNATETAWGKEVLSNCSAVCFITGRVKYIDKELQPAKAPLQGQMLIYFGENIKGFKEQCAEIGEVFIHG